MNANYVIINFAKQNREKVEFYIIIIIKLLHGKIFAFSFAYAMFRQTTTIITTMIIMHVTVKWRFVNVIRALKYSI